MQKILSLAVFMIVSLFVNAQKVTVQDLKNSVGSWDGSLTYLDYSSGKPFTMQANITVSLTPNQKGYIMAFEYPKEPQANSIDTTFVSGQFFGKEKIVELKNNGNRGYTFVTEIDGEDGNDHKKAILRHTYTLLANTFAIKKEVKFKGTNVWVKRNEYLLNKRR